jgi:mutator protein MutT
MRIVVTAAVIEDHGRYFVTRRQQGVHLEGCWEFPGGKCEAGESIHACLKRELREELGVEVVIGDEIFAVTHEYPDRAVELHFLACTLLNAPMPLLGQEMRWVPREELRSLTFPPADDELIARLTDDRQR